MGETVLLVDDDSDVRAYVSEALRIGGFAIAETSLRPIEILVTDINMPGIDGLELARLVQTLRPATAVVCMSGAPADVVAAWGLLAGTDGA